MEDKGKFSSTILTEDGKRESITDLVMHVQQRDNSAHSSFEELYRLYGKNIFVHIQYLVQDVEVAEELCQDTFVAVWINLPKMRTDVPFIQWLRRIAVNRAVDHLRHENKYQMFPLPKDEAEEGDWQSMPPLVENGPGVEDQVCSQESIEQLLSQLSPITRFCLLLNVQCGFSQKEIAEILDIDPRRVSDYICRARKSLCHLYPHLQVRQKRVKSNY